MQIWQQVQIGHAISQILLMWPHYNNSVLWVCFHSVSSSSAALPFQFFPSLLFICDWPLEKPWLRGRIWPLTPCPAQPLGEMRGQDRSEAALKLEDAHQVATTQVLLQPSALGLVTASVQPICPVIMAIELVSLKIHITAQVHTVVWLRVYITTPSNTSVFWSTHHGV